MEVFLLILRLALAAIFGVAGIAKLFDPAGSEKAAGDFGLPKALAKPFATALPVFELAIAIALLFVPSAWFGAIGAAGLFVIFTSGMLYQMAKGNAPDCHCFGQLHSEPVGVSSIVRNVIMLIPAVFLVIQGRANQGFNLISSNQDAMQFIVGLAVLTLLLAAVLFLKKISEQQSQIMHRIELLELIGGSDKEVEREEIGHPREGLPLGALVPNFELPDMNGNIISVAKLREAGKPILFIFVSPTCNPCRALLPRFDGWQKEFEGKVDFVYISNGEVEDNQVKFGSDTSKTILLQKGDEIAQLMRAKWTPMAVLMNTNGRIASFTGAGDIGIVELMRKLTAANSIGEYSYFTEEHFIPQVPLMIGKSVPDLSMLDINGERLGLADLRGKQTLITFWSPTCHHCVEMMNDLKEWDASRSAADPELLVFSDGDISVLTALGLKSHVIPDKGFKTATYFGVFGSPSGIMVDEAGNFVSETTIGAEDTWALIDRSK